MINLADSLQLMWCWYADDAGKYYVNGKKTKLMAHHGNTMKEWKSATSSWCIFFLYTSKNLLCYLCIRRGEQIFRCVWKGIWTTKWRWAAIHLRFRSIVLNFCISTSRMQKPQLYLFKFTELVQIMYVRSKNLLN